MKSTQFTIRNISPKTDAALRARATRLHKSLNQTLIEILERATQNGYQKSRQPTYHDLDDLFGSWIADPDFDEAMKDSRIVDSADWL